MQTYIMTEENRNALYDAAKAVSALLDGKFKAEVHCQHNVETGEGYLIVKVPVYTGGSQ